MKLEIVKGSVVYSDCDVIVNAANDMLMAGGGVCGAIFDAAGRDELKRECMAIGGCRTGHAVMTNGYNLKAKKIIHAVGPTNQDPKLLKSAFLSALIVADSNGYNTIGMVPISAGIYGFPLDECAKIAIEIISNYEAKHLKKCYMYCFLDKEYNTFKNELNNINK